MSEGGARITNNSPRFRVAPPSASAVHEWHRSLPASIRVLSRSARAALDCDGDFVVATGHQSEFFHGGVLAKFIATTEIARSAARASKWVHFMSDADATDPFRIDVPCRRTTRDGREELVRARLHLAGTSRPMPEHAPACTQAARVPRDPQTHGLTGMHAASARASSAITRAIACLAESADAPTAAHQGARAAHSAMRVWVDTPSATLSTRDLMASPFGSFVVDAILAQPEACAVAFNRALAHAPHAARLLRVDGQSSEVPLWTLDDSGNRARANAKTAERARADGKVLLPRAFLASGLMRLHCDLFVHGTGGERYETAGDFWWREFLGFAPPPCAIATADLFIAPSTAGLTGSPPSNLSVPWRAAWWNPTLLERERGLPRISADRSRIVDALAASPRRSVDRRRLYNELMGQIARERASAHDSLASLHETETRDAASRRAWILARDRTWSFLFLEPETITALSDALRPGAHACAEAWLSGSGR